MRKPSPLTEAFAAPHAHFPDAAAAEARLRWRAALASAALWVPVLALSVAAGAWLGPVAAAVVLVAQLLGLAFTVLSAHRGARKMMAELSAYPITERTQPELHALCSDVAERFGIPLPPCYIVEDDSVNAFATELGFSKPVFVLHTGYLKVATPTEVRGVIAHEMAHLVNRDNLVYALTRGSGALLAGSTALSGKSSSYRGKQSTGDLLILVPRLLFGVVLPGLLNVLLKGVSRSREQLADLTGARALGGAEPLLATLRLLSEYERKQTGRSSNVRSVTSTHPPTRRRIEALLDTCAVQVSQLPGVEPTAEAGPALRPRLAARQS
jgi:heat shock protein HtpX